MIIAQIVAEADEERKKRAPREAGQPEKTEGRSGGQGDDTTCSM